MKDVVADADVDAATSAAAAPRATQVESKFYSYKSGHACDHIGVLVFIIFRVKI